MSTTSRGYLTNFDGGYGLSDVQNHALGYIGQDPKGQIWSYVMFTGAVDAGHWVADVRGTTLTKATDAQRTEGDLDLREITTDDRFMWVQRGANHREEMFVGAFGWATDVGFTITSWIPQSANVARIDVDILHDDGELFYDPTDLRSPAWGPSLGDDPNSIGVFMPGRVAVGSTALVPDIRGVVQRTIADTDATPANPKFGWVLQQGIGVCELGDVSAGHRFLSAANPGTFTSSAGRVAATAARVLRDLTATAQDNDLVLAEIRIENNATAFGGPAAKRAVGAGPAVIR